MDLASFKCFTFPSRGGPHVQVNDPRPIDDHPEFLRAGLYTSDQIFDLILVTDVLHRMGHKPPTLILPWLPYARQDRATTDLSPFSLRHMADIINRLNYREVVIYEPHSAVACELIHNARATPMTGAAIQFLDYLGWDPAQTVILAPDKGAVLRAAQIADAANVGAASPYKFACATKERDPSTGWLKTTSVSNTDLSHKRVVVFDDICDGGATFTELAKFLRSFCDPKLLALFVAHGIFSKGTETLFEHYGHIGCTDSFDRDAVGMPALNTSVKVLPSL